MTTEPKNIDWTEEDDAKFEAKSLPKDERLHLLNRCVEEAAKLSREIGQIEETYEMAKDRAISGRAKSLDRLVQMAEDIARVMRDEQGMKTIPLPCGPTAKTTLVAAKLKVVDEAAIPAAFMHTPPPPKPRPSLTDINKHFKASGEIVPGCEEVPEYVSVSIDLSQVGAVEKLAKGEVA